jgi:hypothetical protein
MWIGTLLIEMSSDSALAPLAANINPQNAKTVSADEDAPRINLISTSVPPAIP